MCTSISGPRSSAQASRSATEVWVKRTGVEDHRVAGVGGRMDQVQQVGFTVALPHNSFQAKLLGFAFDQRDQLVVGGAAVDLRLTADRAGPGWVR